MNNSYGHNLVTSIHQITEIRKNKVDLRVKTRWLSRRKKMWIVLVRSLDWLPWLRTDQLDFLDPKKRESVLWDRFGDFVDFDEQFCQIKKYLEGTSILQYFESYRNYQVVLMDNPGNFQDFYEKNTIRLLSMLCGHNQKILFSATISHRGYIGPANKSLMLSGVRLFGKSVVLAEHVWVEYTRRWSAAEPLIGGKKVHIVGKVVQYKRKDSTIDYAIKASKVIRA